MTTNEKQRIFELSDLLYKASSKVRILRNIAWSDEIKVSFFKNKAQKLPVVKYDSFDPSPVLEEIKYIRTLIGKESLEDQWVERIASNIENSALMLFNRGTKDFHRYSTLLYGKPNDLLENESSTIIDLAVHFDKMFDCVQNIDLGEPPKACVMAQSLADEMEKAVNEMFGEFAPKVILNPDMASNALAGRRRISIRPGACFTDKDVQQLIEHEAYVHVGTSINGKLQDKIKILGEAHAGTTMTQEGIAVFAEFITGNLDLDRLRRLSDRVIAIQMAIDGADFIEVFRYYNDKTIDSEQAFQNAKRVFRGGLIEGGAPFTKDIVYLEGFINVHDFLRESITKGDFSYINLLFCGKLNLKDLPVLKQFLKAGILKEPNFLPPWVKDKRYLMTYLSFSSFLSEMPLNLHNK